MPDSSFNPSLSKNTPRQDPPHSAPKALDGLRVLDLSRVLAGPYCTQILGDLGAEIIKVEKPGTGDDTRQWGPPFVKDKNGDDTSESAYYLSINRNKKSIAVNLKSPEGQGLIRELLPHCDILIENFKVGTLKKYNLGYEDLKDKYPHLVYTSITGFGQNGPLSSEPGYDFLAQAMSGLMACTGDKNTPPTKTGIAISDILTGLNAATATLAALHSRQKTGKGQHVDVALLDCSLAAMTNIAQYYLTSRQLPPKVGNAHSTIVPYQSFSTLDGHIVIAVGNNDQFTRLCQFLEQPKIAQDERFSTNKGRVQHREILIPLLQQIFSTWKTGALLSGLYEADVPCAPINTIEEALHSPQIQSRDMVIEMPHPASRQPVQLVGSPLKLSGTPVTYRNAPPACGQDSITVLQDLLGLDEHEIKDLKRRNIIS